MSTTPSSAKKCLLSLFDELIGHDGFGNLKVEMRILRRGQKEVIIDCGKQYRFVVDFQPTGMAAAQPSESATLLES
ncbi:hypothetical protein [Methylovorus sp. MP688]|jgi:hypothetical protein|uniref:hypothetical protein n=1 Tax=Methylovorus sp. (strain MP688) TaxID=887061 RepID=UPI0001EC47B7|nr:hypothetical protein [Methylovorus sp. MP688]ADQ84857.1 conserved hypothetical protein [Methylovorus sp. MP688]